jgi:hypothetical protein
VSTTRLRITLRDVHPAVIRVLDVPTSTTLPELHDLLQAAVGWTDSHLHQFVAGQQRWAVPSEDSWDDTELDETSATLKDLPARFVYVYDFGDSWEHDIEVQGAGAATPGLVDGEGACPPEDCGGVPGHEHLLAVLADATHEDHEHLRSWSAGHPFDFDLARAQILVQQVVGTVPEPVRALLDLIGPGLKLTQAGKLPPATVAALLERCPRWEKLIGVVREDNVTQVWALKDLLREVGLLRLSRGVLTPTKAAGSDAEIVRRLRRRFPDGAFETIMVTNALALLNVHGPVSGDELMGQVLPMMGSRWAVNGQPLDAKGLGNVWSGVWRYLTALDLIVDDGWRGPVTAGPSSLTLLPRAAGLADTLRRYAGS